MVFSFKAEKISTSAEGLARCESSLVMAVSVSHMWLFFLSKAVSCSKAAVSAGKPDPLLTWTAK